MAKKNIQRLLALLPALLAAFALGSCSEDEADSSSSATNDCLVSKVTLGSLKRTIHTTGSQGQDSTYVVSVTGSLYPMYIDQLNNLIYNTDSLPVGTNAQRVTFSALTASGTTLSIRSLVTGTDTVFTSTDSTDFSVPRYVKAYSSDGNSARTYEMRVNVHKQEADSIVWKQYAGSFARGYTAARVLCVGGHLYIYGREEGKTCLTVTPTSDPDFGTQTEVSAPGGALDANSVRWFGGAFYALAGGSPVVSRDGGATFVSAGATQAFDGYAGQSTDSLYAVSGGDFYVSANGVDWTLCAADEAGNRPAANVDGVLVPSRVNSQSESVLAVGWTADGAACVWKHDIDRSGSFTYPWMYLPQTDEIDGYTCPALNGSTLFRYDSATVLAGTDAEGKAQPFYVSRDNGRTWNAGGISHPDWGTVTALGVAADEDNFVWVVCGGTGQVWRGRINRLGWEEQRTVYNKSPRR